jgi:hypothetical protein
MTVFDMQAFTKRTLVSKLKLVDSQRIMKLSQDSILLQLCQDR